MSSARAATTLVTVQRATLGELSGKWTASVKQDGHLKVFRVVRAVKDRSLTALNTSQFTDEGSALAYTVTEGSETGKSNDLCSSWFWSLQVEVNMIQELRLKVQVPMSTS
jgi:hypothetical protein